jgi:hypothetical protein
MALGFNVKVEESSTYGNQLPRPSLIYEGTSEHLPVFGFALSSVDFNDKVREAKPEKTDIIPFEVRFKGQEHIYTWNGTVIQHYDLASITQLNIPDSPLDVVITTSTYNYLAATSPTNSAQVTYQGVKVNFSGMFSLPFDHVHISHRDGLEDVVTTNYVEEVTGAITQYLKDPDIPTTPISFQIKDPASRVYTADSTVAARPVYGLPWEGFPIPPS